MSSMHNHEQDITTLLDSSVLTEPAPDNSLDLIEYLRIIKIHKWQIIVFALVSTIIGVLTAFSMTPIYVATVSLLIEPDQPKIISLDPLQNNTNIKYFYETQREIINSRKLASSVVEKLELENHPEFDEKQNKNIKSYILELIPEGWLPEDNLPINEESAASKLLDEFNERLYVSNKEQSQVMQISFEASDPGLSADVANAVAEAYVNTGLESRLSVVEQASSWLTGRLEELRAQLNKSEKALQDYQIAEGIVDTESQKEIISGKLASVTAGIVEAQTKRIEAEIRFNQVKEAANSGEGYDSLRPVLQHPLVQTLKEEQSRLQRRVAELGKRYGAKHPKMIAAKSDLNESAQRLDKEINKVVDGITREYEVALKNERELLRLSERMKVEKRGLKGKEFELAKLEREVATNRQLYDAFFKRIQETQIASENDVTNVQIVDMAEPPTHPAKPKKVLIAAGSMAAGLFLGILLAFARDHLDKTFKSHEDVERYLALPALGSLHYLKKENGIAPNPERYALDNPKSPFSEAINNIRTGVLFSNLDAPSKTILVTSSIPGEGKTTLSTNLAASLSRLGRTLLMDADLRKPGLATVFDLEIKDGLTSLVSGEKKLRDCISKMTTGTLSFYVLASGDMPMNPIEFLSSKKFAKTFKKLKKVFDYIVVDTAPVLPYSDAIALGHLVDEVILLVRADHTTHDAAQEAVKRFVSSNIMPLGVVLSQVDIEQMSGYGGYYYYYNQYAEQNVEET